MKFVVLYAGKYPLRFHRNLCGDVYSAVSIEEASLFASEHEAMRTAIAHRMERHHCTIVRAESLQTASTPGFPKEVFNHHGPSGLPTKNTKKEKYDLTN